VAKSSAKKTGKTGLPGVPLDHFEAGVRALVELRDRGKFLVFLARMRSAQLIGSRADFLEELTLKLGAETVEPKDSEEVLEEIRNCLSARISFGSSEQVVRFLLQSAYAIEVKELESPAKEQFRKQLEKKVSFVEQQLHTPALLRRDERFSGTTAGCLEDLEYELVQERGTAAQDEPFREPFLRLRVRYSKGTEAAARFLGLGFFSGFPFSASESSFELECDESDIDLMMIRLATAKQRLARARDSNSEI
jgi:hypothetical protein